MQKSPWPYFLSFFLVTPTIVWGTIASVMGFQWEEGIGHHLHEASIAPTMDDAKRELDHALSLMEKKGMVEGYTSVMWKSEDDSVAVWHWRIASLRKSLDVGFQPVYDIGFEGEREIVGKEARTISLSAASVTLSRVKEVLTMRDSNSSTLSVRSPIGISRFPYARSMGWLFIFACPLSFAGLVVFLRHLIK